MNQNSINELVSVIIPTYNAEFEINDCIETLLQQTYDNFEIIIVNDGSTDKTKEICELLLAKYKNITLINQDNSGVSSARNIGIEKANGEWIVFLDADDRMVPEAIENAIKQAKQMNCDTVCWNCFKDYEGTISKYPEIKPNNSVFQKKEELAILIEALYQTRNNNFYPGYMFRAVWGKLLSAKLIKQNGICFPVGQPLGEDAAFLVDYFKVSKKVLLINQYWNFYKISSFSAVRQYRSNIKELQELEFNLLNEKIKDEEVDKETILVNQLLQFDYQFIHNLCQKEDKFKMIFKEMKTYISNRKLKGMNLKNFDKEKVNKNSLPIIWSMVHDCIYLETILCMIREYKQYKK